MILRLLKKSFLCLLAVSFAVNMCYAQTPASAPAANAAADSEVNDIKDSLSASENVTLDFKDADIHNVLKILAKKANINIVATPDVMGTVSIKLVDVPWDRAMDVILKSNGFGYQKQGNVILVTKLENMAKIQADEPLRTEIVNLRFLDAQDAQRILIPMLTARGKISILYTRGQKGWKFGTFRIGKEQVAAAMQEREGEQNKQETIAYEKKGEGAVASKIESDPSIKSKTLIITDTDANLDRIIHQVLPQVDRKPHQVLIEARIMEVNRDKLKDLGIDYGIGQNGATSTGVGGLSANSYTFGDKSQSIGGNMQTGQILPTTFSPKSSDISGVASGLNTGLNLLFRKLSGTQFEVLAHALEEDVQANTLSAPRIVTLDNQEASMLVGYHYPILASTVSAGSSTEGPTQTQTLDYYQEIGIRLNVVPQISEDGYINMIIHPSVTSSTSSVTATNVAGTDSQSNQAIQTRVQYPVIDVREAQTQILMRDGETIVIGGLLKDVTSKSVIGVPFLAKIPLLGALFKRETVNTAKVDLLIFITAHVIKDEEFSPAEIGRMVERLNNPVLAEKKAAIEKRKAQKRKK
ncbi:MAG: secretin and TonB N-terminal domain-containing protein [Deltaproteobacteria bacterium]